MPLPTKLKIRKQAASALREVHEREAQRNRAVEEEIEADVEEATAIGGFGAAGDGAINAVGDPVDQHQHQRQQRPPQPERRNHKHANKKADQRNLIGVYAAGNEPGSKAVRWRVDKLTELRVNHGCAVPSNAGLEAFALHALAHHLAVAANGFCLFALAALGWLFEVPTESPRNTLAL